MRVDEAQEKSLLVSPSNVIEHRVPCGAGAGLVEDEQVL